MTTVSEGCPKCGAPIVTELTINSRMIVVCANRHRSRVAGVQRVSGIGREDQYEMEEEVRPREREEA